MPSVIESYLVSLNFAPDQPSLTKFQGYLKIAEGSVTSSASGMVADFLKFQFAATGAFVAVGLGAIGFIDKLAMSDQQMRLFGMRSFMTTQQARSVQTALNVMGVSLEDVSWDKELHGRFMTLIADQKQLSAMLGPQYEKQMVDVRDVIGQFQRLEVKGEYFGMKFAGDLLKKLGLGDGNILHELENLNDFVMKNMPQWSDELSNDILPVLHDFWDIMKGLGGLAEDAALEFTNLVEVLSGNNAIEGSTFDFHKFADALKISEHWLSEIVQDMIWIEQKAIRIAPVLAGAAGGGAVGGVAGGIIGTIGGIPGGPVGMLAGGAAGTAFGGTVGSVVGGIAGTAVMLKEEADRYGGTSHIPDDMRKMLASYTGSVDPKIIAAVAQVESGSRQFDKNGHIITSPVGALGLMQLMPQTARGLGVDPTDAAQNLKGGAMLLQHLSGKYNNWDNALAAYNWGEGNVDKALRQHRAFPTEVQQYARNVESRAGITVGSIVVNVPPTNVSHEQIQLAVVDGVRKGMTQQTRRNTDDLAGVYQ